MTKSIAMIGAASAILLSTSLGWAESETDESRRAIFTEVGAVIVQSDIAAMQRQTSRNFNYFTSRPASGKN
jgi:hypothetical protein